MSFTIFADPNELGSLQESLDSPALVSAMTTDLESKGVSAKGEPFSHLPVLHDATVDALGRSLLRQPDQIFAFAVVTPILGKVEISEKREGEEWVKEESGANVGKFILKSCYKGSLLVNTTLETQECKVNFCMKSNSHDSHR